MGKASLDSFLNQKAGTDKVASDSVPGNQSSVIDKLTALSNDLNKVAADKKPGEGTVATNSEVVADPSAEVKAQTDAVIDDQLAIDAPGAEQEQAAGDKPVKTTGVKPVASTTGGAESGTVKPSAETSVEPESAILAKQPTNKTASTEEDVSDPKVWAKVAAREFTAEMEKIAQEKEVIEAASFLKQAGVLEGYDVEGLNKIASSQFNAKEVFQKIANKKELTDNEILFAANYVSDDLEKEANEEHQAELEKIAAEELEAEILQKEAEEKAILEKLASNPEIAGALEIFRKHNVIQ